jgi:hypothetical protein
MTINLISSRYWVASASGEIMGYVMAEHYTDIWRELLCLLQLAFPLMLQNVFRCARVTTCELHRNHMWSLVCMNQSIVAIQYSSGFALQLWNSPNFFGLCWTPGRRGAQLRCAGVISIQCHRWMGSSDSCLIPVLYSVYVMHVCLNVFYSIEACDVTLQKLIFWGISGNSLVVGISSGMETLCGQVRDDFY